MKKQRNYTTYLLMAVLLLVILMAMRFVGSATALSNAYTVGRLERDLQSGKVVDAALTPYADTPTGSAEVLLKDCSRQKLYATDIREV